MLRLLIKELPNKVYETTQHEVLVQAHVHTLRKLGKMTFLVLRDRSGFCQALVPFKLTETINPQAVVEVIGKVNRHKESKYNGIEIYVTSITTISKAEILPLAIHKPEPHSWNLQYQYRPLALRQLEEIAIFKIQATMLDAYREYLTSQDFVEISSTKLSKSGIEGGSELFNVDFFDEKLFLTQSPQFYKQMMVGSLERVFEIGKVYRAEGANSNRHLAEYIGLDLEMGFIPNAKSVMDVETAVLNHMFREVFLKNSHELEILNVKLNDFHYPGIIPTLHYKEVVEIFKTNYNIDIGMEGLNHAQEVQLGEYCQKEMSTDWVFIYPYPTHLRPFYAMPCQDDETYSETFELLYKGLEVTSGGQRIHDYEMLVKRIVAKNLNPASFESYLMPFKYGMPLHGGFGIGLERIMMQMLNLHSVEVASLIPRTNTRFLH